MAGSALMAGLAIATPVLGATVSSVGSISDLVTEDSFPMFVVGASAATEDVASAINIAVNLASYSKTTETISATGTTSESVTGGVKIMTPGTQLIPYSGIQSVKSVLTSADMTILADGTYQTLTGSSSVYKQYLYIQGETAPTTANTVQFVTETGEDDPAIHFKATGNEVLTTYKMTFSTPVSMSAVTASSSTTLQAVLQGTTIEIMGKEFVITDCTAGVTGTVITDLTLVGGKNVITVTSGSDKTVTVNDKDYVVHLEGVATSGGSLIAVGDINGESIELLSGATDTLSDGTLVAAVKVIQGKTGEADYVKLAIGADKVKVVASGTVKKDDKSVTGLTSTITSSIASGWSGMTILWTPQNDAFVKSGEKLSDPFAGTFDIEFSGITPALDDATNRQTIQFTPSQYAMKLKYMNAAGDEEDMYSLYYSLSGGTYSWRTPTAITAGTSDNSIRDVIFDESKNISQIDGDYFVVGKSGFSRVLQFSSWDVASGALEFTDGTNTFSATNTSATTCDLVVDGHTYKVYTGGDTGPTMGVRKTVNIDLNGDGYIAGTASATFANPADNLAGAEYSYLVPKLITSGQGGLYFYNGNQSEIVSTGVKYPEIGIGGIRLTSDNTTLTVATLSAGTWTDETTTLTLPVALGIGQQLSQAYTIDNIDYTVNCYNTSTTATSCDVGLGTSNSTTAYQTAPGYVLVEEAQQGSTTHNWVFMPVSYSTTGTLAVYMAPAVSDDANYANYALTGASTSQGMTTFGTLVEYYTGSGVGAAKLSYPDSFAYGNLYVMTPEGTVSASAAAGDETTADTVLPITTDIVKLDSEYSEMANIADDVIIVGGPAVNKVAAWLLGVTFPAYGADSGIPENKALVKVVADAFTEGNTAVLVAGWNAADTDFAAQVIQRGGLAGQTAGEVIISGTVVSSPTIVAVEIAE